MTDTKKTILFDFEKGDLSMKNMIIDTSSEIKAIKNKIEKLIKTETKIAPIYKFYDYGINKEKVIGKEYGSHIKDVQSLVLEIKNKIMKINGVKNIPKWDKKIDRDKLILNFEIDTIYGSIRNEVEI